MAMLPAAAVVDEGGVVVVVEGGIVVVVEVGGVTVPDGSSFLEQPSNTRAVSYTHLTLPTT